MPARLQLKEVLRRVFVVRPMWMQSCKYKSDDNNDEPIVDQQVYLLLPTYVLEPHTIIHTWTWTVLENSHAADKMVYDHRHRTSTTWSTDEDSRIYLGLPMRLIPGENNKFSPFSFGDIIHNLRFVKKSKSWSEQSNQPAERYYIKSLPRLDIPRSKPYIIEQWLLEYCWHPDPNLESP